jgi:hypothetical protein
LVEPVCVNLEHNMMNTEFISFVSNAWAGDDLSSIARALKGDVLQHGRTLTLAVKSHIGEYVIKKAAMSSNDHLELHSRIRQRRFNFTLVFSP